MKKDEIKKIIDRCVWELIDETKNFSRYRSKTPFNVGPTRGLWLRHVPKGVDEVLERASRNVDNWNGIHDPADKAYESTNNQWIAPYFGARISSDEKVAREAFAIYVNQRYLVYDACEPRAFLSGARGAFCVSVINSSRCGDALDGWISEACDPYYERFITTPFDEVPRPLTASVIQELRYIERHSLAHHVLPYLTWENLSCITPLRKHNVIPDAALISAAFSLDPKLLSSFAKKVSALQFLGYPLDERALNTLIAIVERDEAGEIEDRHLGNFLTCEHDYHILGLAVRYGYMGLMGNIYSRWGRGLIALEHEPGWLPLALEAATTTEINAEKRLAVLKALHSYGSNMNAQLSSELPEMDDLTPLDLLRRLGDAESERFLVSLDAWTRLDFAWAREISTVIDGQRLIPIGYGAYNTTYRTPSLLTINGCTGLWVVKYPFKDPSEEGKNRLNNNKRAIRKWNMIHSKPQERAYVLTEGRWIAPYCGSIPASDAAIQLGILDIYRSTRELVRDGCAKNNFLFFNGRAYCVDVDLMRTRRHSVCSQDPELWASEDKHLRFLDSWRARKPLTVSTIYCIEYMERYLHPEEIEDAYLTAEMIAKLMLVHKDIPLSKQIMEIFRLQRLEQVGRFIRVYDRLKISGLLFKGPEDIYSLLYICFIDTACELPDRVLQSCIIALREGSVGYVAYLAAELGALLFLQRWCEQVPESIDMPTMKNMSPLMAAANSAVIIPSVRIRVFEFFIARAKDIDLNRQMDYPGSSYHGCSALDLVMRRGDIPSARLLHAAGARKMADLDLASGARSGFFSARSSAALAEGMPTSGSVYIPG